MDEAQAKAVIAELARIRFRVGVCALVLSLPFLVAGAILTLYVLMTISR